MSIMYALLMRSKWIYIMYTYNVYNIHNDRSDKMQSVWFKSYFLFIYFGVLYDI